MAAAAAEAGLRAVEVNERVAELVLVPMRNV
jgi:hypothetical protein